MFFMARIVPYPFIGAETKKPAFRAGFRTVLDG